MRYVSTEGKTAPATFRSGVFAGLAPDGGLYIPESLPVLPRGFVDGLSGESFQTIGVEVTAAFIDDISRDDLASLAAQAWTFPVPLVHLVDNLYVLELFHGPTLAFKDIGVRFLARILSHYLQRSRQEITIVVATSGDTGSAVAHGFFGVPGISVYILYPSGKISALQEQQMATLGGNIHALEVDGTFDDCQRLVKQALADEEVVEARHLTTANSINLGRLLPQIGYYVWGVAQWEASHRSGNSDEGPTFVVPSGNFGNVTAAAYARAMGTPFGHIVAATNVNDAGAEYLRAGTFVPRTAVQTHSNAMDVGNPSNLTRLRSHFGDDVHAMQRQIDAVSVTDEETLHEIRLTYEQCGTVVDPHTAVGLAAARRRPADETTIVTATAHPGKFPDVIERALGMQVPLPEELLEALKRPKQSEPVPAEYEAFRELLLRRWCVT
jgi:threonine synthase